MPSKRDTEKLLSFIGLKPEGFGLTPKKDKREELMARLDKKPNVPYNKTGAPKKAAPSVDNDRTDREVALFEQDIDGLIKQRDTDRAAAPAPKESFTDAVNRRMVTPTPMRLLEEDVGKGLNPKGPIDVSRSPITGLPSPKLGVDNDRPLALKKIPIDPNKPLDDYYALDLALFEQDIDSAIKQRDADRAAVPAPAVDMEAAKALFTRTHGKGGFDPKSKMDQAKMKDILSLMGDPKAASLTPNQFAMQIYKNQKSRK